jgi:hypothetical protein
VIPSPHPARVADGSLAVLTVLRMTKDDGRYYRFNVLRGLEETNSMQVPPGSGQSNATVHIGLPRIYCRFMRHSYCGAYLYNNVLIQSIL